MSTNPKIIIVDDDEDLRESLSDYLSENGLDVIDVADGVQFRAKLADISADLVILDLKLPGEDGLSLCRYVRKSGRNMGIIMLTGVADPIDRIAGLEVGADDYIPKPFEPRELLARIRSVLRRTRAVGANEHNTTTNSSTQQFAGCRIDLTNRTVSRPDGRVEKLTPMEAELLIIFAERPGQLLSRDALLGLTSDGSLDASFDRAIDLRIMRLRKKVEVDPARPQFILTLRGEGYRYDPAGGGI